MVKLSGLIYCDNNINMGHLLAIKYILLATEILSGFNIALDFHKH